MELNKLYGLWDKFGDVPTCLKSSINKIDESFLHFEKGAPVEQIWHWFEAQNKRFIAGRVMEGERLTPITGSANRLPIVDRNGTQICLGDNLVAQVNNGRYGQTRLVEFVAKDAHMPLPYVCELFDGKFFVANFHYEKAGFDGDGWLRGYLDHQDVEHAHEQWVQIAI